MRGGTKLKVVGWLGGWLVVNVLRCCLKDLVCDKSGRAAWQALCTQVGLPETLDPKVAYEDDKFYALVVAGATVWLLLIHVPRL
jgi:hypothetical protein